MKAHFLTLSCLSPEIFLMSKTEEECVWGKVCECFVFKGFALKCCNSRQSILLCYVWCVHGTDPNLEDAIWTLPSHYPPRRDNSLFFINYLNNTARLNRPEYDPTCTKTLLLKPNSTKFNDVLN